jgi:hypothetical protein
LDSFRLGELPFVAELAPKFSLLQSLGMIISTTGVPAFVRSSEAANDVKGTCLRFFIDASDTLTNHSQKKKQRAGQECECHDQRREALRRYM